MFVARPFIFRCDFCGICIAKIGAGLPKNMKWISANFLKNEPIRHICGDCVEKGRHGDEKLKDSGCKSEGAEQIVEINHERFGQTS
jgi:hypothetical protein